MSTLVPPASPRRLGKSDLSVGPIAYGCWRFAGGDLAASRAKIETALDLGMTLIDTADIYGCDTGHGVGAAESLLGEVLADAPALRGRMVLASKAGIVLGTPYDSSAAHLREACEASLRRLRSDVIDLYQIHRPDLLAHPAEVAATLAELRQAGKIREVGVSNHSPAQFDALQAHLPFAIATHQPELSVLRLDPLFDGVLDQCLRTGATPLAWSPLAGGLLGSAVEQARSSSEAAHLAALLEALDGLAAARGVARGAVALAFLMAHPAGVIPIVGSQRLERIRECAEAARVELTRSEWYHLVEASRGESLP
jgi:predicted oxidoreductase